MFHIVLFEPRIPQNTGNIARTCAVTGCSLHMIKPYAFKITDRAIRRAGLTYWHLLDIYEYDSLDDFLRVHDDKRMFLMSSKGQKNYADARFKADDFFVFGREDTGVPPSLYERLAENTLRIPMLNHPEARCLNVSTSVGVVLYEALRQVNFLNIN